MSSKNEPPSKTVNSQDMDDGEIFQIRLVDLSLIFASTDLIYDFSYCSSEKNYTYGNLSTPG